MTNTPFRVFSYSGIGTFHVDHNEDALWYGQLNDRQYAMAVMDGCSMGEDSHFASCLISKLLRKIAKEMAFLSFHEKTQKSLDESMRSILQQFFNELRSLKNTLGLEVNELLSTLVFAVVDVKERSARVRIMGDGMVVCNGEFYEYDQNDKPDYPAYHLGKDFNEWLGFHSQELRLEDVSYLCLSTDGIFTFSKATPQGEMGLVEKEVLGLLTAKEEDLHNSRILKKKVLSLKNDHNMVHTDDLTLVKIQFF